MELCFDMQEVARWARFSGDYNPIHFDLERARELGTDALIVHGMLALMPVKRALGTGDSGSTSAWRRFKALMRVPIPHGGRLQLSTRSGTRGLQFRADGGDVPAEFFRGSVSDGEDPALAHLLSPVIIADSPLDAAQFARFQDCYGDGDSDGWVALDAVLFADFMRTKIRPLQAWTRERVEPRMAIGIERALIVHTSHTVTFATAACAPGGAARSGELSYDVHAPDVIPGDGQVICTVPLTVKADGVVVMAVALGLLLKTPLVASPQDRTSSGIPEISHQGATP